MSETASNLSSASPTSRKGKLLTCLGLIAVLAVGLSLRLYKLDQPLMWCDEAESCINALTILKGGLPTDTYMGLPIYENTLTEPWPESKEYEFKDSSYSRTRLAIYHGWLPLYSIAGSLKAFGITPDVENTSLTLKHDASEIARRTVAGRLPSVIASVVFMILLFIAAREMYGADAGWAAISVAAVAVPMVNIARQARYYSLTACLSAACCLAGWRVYKRGWWRDFIFAGIVFSMMFHTHILTFAIACVACSTLLPFLFRHEKIIPKLLLAGSIIAVATVPWMVATGFLGSAQSVPKAIATMKLPTDLLSWPMKQWEMTTLLVVGMLFSMAIHMKPQWFSDRIHRAYGEYRGAFYFLGAWILIAFVMFMTLIPAASLFFHRLYLGAVGPGIIFGAMVFAGIGRAIGRRVAIPLAMAGFVLFAITQTYTIYAWNKERVQLLRMTVFMDEMRDTKLRPGTKMYATPNDHLTLQYYTGLPIQSIAPVRKSFLDNYPGDIMYVSCMIPVWPINSDDVRKAADGAGVHLDDEEAYRWVDKLNIAGAGRKVAPAVQAMSPEMPTVPEWGEGVLAYQLERTAEYRRKINYEMMNPSVFRGFTHYREHATMWQVFFYRFVDPDSRVGPNLNYANRLQRATARVLPTLWVVYTSPGVASSDQASIEEKK